MSILERNFVKVYEPSSAAAGSAQKTYVYTTMVRHNGTVIAFAMDSDRHIYYTVLDMERSGVSTSLDSAFWDIEPKELIFPDELAIVGKSAAGTQRMPLVNRHGVALPAGTLIEPKERDSFQSTTARLSASLPNGSLNGFRPFQVLSDEQHVYIFRQSAARDASDMVWRTSAQGEVLKDAQGRPIPVVDNTLLMDRFVFTGGQLQPKLEVRYQRSRRKDSPASRKDGLGYEDLEKKAFYEPTQTLDFVRNLTNGWFTVLLLPTAIPDVQRWQIFAYNRVTQRFDSFNIERSPNGSFNTRGTQYYTSPKPEHQQDVFERQPGTCPFSGEPLIPLLSQSGFAESALLLDGVDDAVAVRSRERLNLPGANGFTLEMWLLADPAQISEANPDEAPTAQFNILEKGTGRGECPYALRYLSNGKLGFFRTDGQKTLALISEVALTDGQFHHVAVVRTATPRADQEHAELPTITLYIDGVDTGTITDDLARVPVNDDPLCLGNRSTQGDYFTGQIDELRIWSRVRSPRELEIERHHRLVGNELDLVSYWRCDEGTGTVLYDQTDFAQHGQITGSEHPWIKSEAPVGEHPGIRRSSFAFQARAVTAGCTALFYYQQEPAGVGYAAEEKKPIKRNGRLMFAVPTEDRSTDRTSKSLIAVLDFAVSRDGSLAQVPDLLNLQQLDAAKIGDRTLSDTLEEYSQLQQNMQRWTSERVAKTTTLGHVNKELADLPICTGQYTHYVDTLHGRIDYQLVFNGKAKTQGARIRINLDGSGQRGKPDVKPIQTLLDKFPAWDGLDALVSFGDVNNLHLFRKSACKEQYNIVTTVHNTAYFSSIQDVFALDTLNDGLNWEQGIDAAVRADNQVYLFKRDRCVRLQRERNGQNYFFNLKRWTVHQTRDIFKGVPPEWLNTGIDGVIWQGHTGYFLFFKGSQFVYTSLAAQAPEEPMPDHALLDLGYGYLLDFYRATSSEMLAERDRLESEIAVLNLQIAEGDRQLARLRQAMHQFGQDNPLPMPFVCADPTGLTVSGAVLGFAWTKDTPLLFESVTGRLSLYYRGTSDQFFAAYYDVVTGRASFSQPETPGLRWIARSAGAALDSSQITITAEDADTCTVAIQNAATGIQEKWQRVPRDRAQFAAVLNGMARPVYLGKLTEALSGSVAQFDLESAATHSLKAGDTLLIGSGKTKAVVQAAQPVLPKGEVPGFQGRSLSFNGSSDFVELTTAETLGLPNRSFTVEAWINLAADAPRDCPVLGSAAPRAALRALHLTIRDRRPYLGFFGEANDLSSPIVLQPERWYHVAWRYDSIARTQSILVNGQLVATATNRSALLGGGPLFMGQWNGDRHFKGQIGELRIWNEARSEADIAAGMRRVLNDPTGAAWQTLAGSWRFALSEGRLVAQDDSRHQRHGKVLGSPALRRVNSQIMQVQIDPVDLVCQADEGVYLLPYDYDAHAQINQIARSLQDGSLLFLVDAGNEPEPVQPGTAVLSDDTLSNHWVADAYGYALSFDAAARPVTTTQRLADYQTEANLTIEAWVKHSAFPKGFTEILKNQSGSPSTRYRLGISHDLDALRENAPIYRVFAEVGGKLVYTDPMASANQWQHLAAVFEQAHALRFKAGDRLDCGSDTTLELAGDLTIEAVIRLDDLAQPQGILTKGKIQDGSDDDCTYSLSVNKEGKLVFAFEDNQDSPENHFLKSSFSLQPNQVYHVGVTRQHRTETAQGNAQVSVNQWYEFHFYARSQDGVQYEIWKSVSKAENPERFEGTIGSGSQPLEIGWAVCQTDPRDATKMAAHSFRGELGEVRLWSRALTASELGKAIKGREKGLVGWWQLEENQGAIAQDSKGTNHATIYGARWVQSSDPEASRLRLYLNGDVVMTHVWSASNTPYAWSRQKPPFEGTPGFSLGTDASAPTANPALQRHAFTGELDEVRIWKVARTLEQIQDNLFRPIAGDFEQLLAYYHASEVGNTLQDGSGRGLHLAIPGTAPNSPLTDATLAYFALSTAPVSTETAQVRSALAQVKTDFHDVLTNAPAVQEYGDMQSDSAGNLIGVMKRCYAYIRNGQWRLLTGYKVGNLELEWVGQAQYDPQLIGFIEGAPPVPSENLTVRDTYEKVSTVELTEADQMMYTYANTRDRSYKTALNMKLGAGFKVKNEAGFGLVVETVNTNLVLGIKGNMETNTSWLQNSTVSFGKTTNTLSRLTAQGDWEEAAHPRYPELGRRYVPKNVGFALVQSETADVFVMRLKHRDPARRVTVALRMQPNPDIPKDWNVIMFPMNPKYVKQGTLDGRMGLNADAVDYPNTTDSSPDRNYFKPIEAYALKQRIEREQKELEADYRSYDVEPAGKKGMARGTPVLPLVGTSIGAAIEGGIALNQEDKLPELTRRNLFNTYVWTADGGLFAETQQFMETQQEVIGGTFSVSGQIGGYMDFNTAIAGMAVNFELESFWGGSQTLTKTKTSASQRSFGVTVDLDVERNIQVANPQQAERLGLSLYDAKGDRAKCPGKVDGYRFMTFYLEPSQEHFKDFENKVIDRTWLEQSNDPNAIALRQSIQQKVGKPWRVMHRVTYVSRVLPWYGSPAATPAEDTLRAANIESNWELIKRLEPYVQSKTRSYGDLADAIREVISRFMPELASAESYIIEYMSRYYQVFPDSVLQSQVQ
ncbi:hypothetical protein P7L53_14885 [Thermoleptolyngbya sichuanensis XZ-Cy5]|uniref:LamG-like jellyroll fold domain-containing protein n=1 Tax=Thermoleptolyngbya sichuanensis TaxID=2885951 RepID=UPI00240CFDE4|nr:LamG-like jellyroll fold domain-containing protein [Thermoleptolyngbya sichuanensis]MDG2617524.1 hypothetical protein [Thermoleptolyngbya sichuanensis XZ-Cy5]